MFIPQIAYYFIKITMTIAFISKFMSYYKLQLKSEQLHTRIEINYRSNWQSHVHVRKINE